MHFAITVADVNMNCFVLQPDKGIRPAIGEDQVADVDIGSYPGMATLVDESHHLADIVQQAQPEGLKLQCNIHIFLISVIAQDATGFQSPAPLICGRDHFLLPQVLTQDQHDIPGSELGREIDERLQRAT